MIQLKLPYPPSINHYYERGCDGNLHVGDKGKIYRRQVQMIVALYRIKERYYAKQHLKVSIYAFTPDHRPRDVDNILKCLLDAITDSGIWTNDKQVYDLRVVKNYDVNKKGYVLVSIDEIKQGDT